MGGTGQQHQQRQQRQSRHVYIWTTIGFRGQQKQVRAIRGPVTTRSPPHVADVVGRDISKVMSCTMSIMLQMQ